jgi:FAD/FMN-containing dehydrogenase
METLTSHEPALLDEMSGDFGRIVTRRPRAVVRPASAGDVVALLARARAEGAPVSTRGAAHSQSGQSLTDGGYVLDMTSLSHIGAIDTDAGTVTCEAGVVWSDLVAALAPHHLVPPVLTNNLNVTVGGTLSMAGLGVASFRAGTQADNCTALTVVTGAGDVVPCSATKNRELFDLARCGLGQFGVITEATLRVRPYKPFVRTYYLLYDNLPQLLTDFDMLMVDERFDYLESWCVPCPQGFRTTPAGRNVFARWFYPLHASIEIDAVDSPADDAELAGLMPYERVHVETVPFTDFAHRLDMLFALWRSSGYWANAHPWMETILPWPAVVPYISSVLHALPPPVLGGGHVLLWPGRSATSTVPHFMTPQTELVMGFGILPGVPQSALPIVLPMLDHMSEASVAAGGKRYLSGRIAFTREQWRAHFGEHWPTLCAAKKRYDPAGLLNPGFVAWE